MRADLDKKIPSVLCKRDLALMVILVLDDQEVVYARGFGYADIDNEQQGSADIAYRIGSISKLFTAAAILQLHERKVLDIDAPLQRYLPVFSIKTPYDVKRIMLTDYFGLPSDIEKPNQLI